jgi:F-type H+-transporting ATPase subunit gamma
MTNSTASLRHNIDTAGELQSVVRTMKAMAASSIGQYEKSVRALADYYRAVELGLSVCIRHSAQAALPVQRRSKDVAVMGAVVFGSDQGLVGRFNELIVEHAMSALRALPARRQRVWAVGERVHSRLTDARLPLAGLFAVPNSVQAIAPLVGQILMATEAGRGEDEIAEFHLFYNRLTSGSGYEPVSQRLLPLDAAWGRELAELAWPAHNLPEVMGDNAATLRALVREYLFISLFRACAESLASENASRLAAMQRAEKNIDELLETLHVAFYRARQSGIDEELFDVISGFEALSGGDDGAQAHRKSKSTS